jgi:WhiB family redox-sensing transcriptional regulator
MLDTSWMSKGSCKSLPPETFFPSDGLGVEAAQSICAKCPVVEACLEYALIHRIEHGVWGGQSERGRRRILRARRMAAAGIADSGLTPAEFDEDLDDDLDTQLDDTINA